MGTIGREMDKQNPEFYMELQCIIHNAQCVQTLRSLKHFMGSYGFNHGEFQFFSIGRRAEYEDVMYHTEVRWLICRTALKHFLALRLETEILMNEKARSWVNLEVKSGLGFGICM